MPVFVIGATHAEVDSGQLAALTTCGEDLVNRLTGDETGEITGSAPGAIRGVIILATCNRFEVYVHADTFYQSAKLVRRELAETATGATLETISALTVRRGAAAVEHLFEVASGLDSMVVGEHEIAGQVKTALRDAKPHASAQLHRLFQAALTSSKKVATHTDLGASGRSLATVGLDHIEATHGPYRDKRVLLVGTGAFARITVAELRRRGVGEIAVYSPTGRAHQFAHQHDLVAVDSSPKDFLAWVDAVVCCSGTPGAISTELLREARTSENVLPILDLSLEGDVESTAADLEGINLVGLDHLGAQSPSEESDALEAANQIVQDCVAQFLDAERARQSAHTVTVMRQHFQNVIEAELASVAQRYPEETAQVVAETLHRVSNELLHTPTVRAAESAKAGDLDSYQRALQTVFGFELEELQ